MGLCPRATASHPSRRRRAPTRSRWTHTFRLYQRDDRDENACLEPRVTEDTISGMIQRVKDVLLGRRHVAGSIGLIQTFRLGAGPITDAEKAFMQFAPNGLGAGVRTLARYDEGMARLFVEHAAPVIAVEMTQVILTDMLRAVEAAPALDNHAYAKQIKGRRYMTAEQAHRALASAKGRAWRGSMPRAGSPRSRWRG